MCRVSFEKFSPFEEILMKTRYVIGLVCSLVLIEFALAQTDRFIAADPVNPVNSLLASYDSLGVDVTDEEAARLIGGQTACSDWDVDGGGCCWLCAVCPNNFNTFDDSYWFSDYHHAKQNSTRECSGGAANSCYEGVIDSLIGCTI
jgi:hypothetical protein